MQQSLQEKRKKMGIVQYVYFMSNYFSYFGYCMSCILGEIAVSLIHQRKPIQRANGNPARSRRGGRPTFTCSYHLFSLLLRQLRSIGAKLFFCLKTYTKEKNKKILFFLWTKSKSCDIIIFATQEKMRVWRNWQTRQI